MTNPWMIMLVGVLTVFLALAMIILFLLAFPWFFGLFKPKAHKSQMPLPEIVERVEHPSAPKEDEEELIAVLTAAVASMRGAAPGSFAITSVKPSAHAAETAGAGFNTPVWGRVERLVRK